MAKVLPTRCPENEQLQYRKDLNTKDSKDSCSHQGSISRPWPCACASTRKYTESQRCGVAGWELIMNSKLIAIFPVEKVDSILFLYFKCFYSYQSFHFLKVGSTGSWIAVVLKIKSCAAEHCSPHLGFHHWDTEARLWVWSQPGLHGEMFSYDNREV